MKPEARLLRILITAGPTHEPIDPVRYIGNRSSGRMGAALAEAAISAGHRTTVIAGPVAVPFPSQAVRIDVETAAQMEAVVLQQFPDHDLLIMAAAVADFRPKSASLEKLSREGSLIIECDPTPDIVASAAKQKRPDQRIIGFSLESSGGVDRATEKLRRKGLDMMVYNPVETMNSSEIAAVLIYAGAKSEPLSLISKTAFAELLIFLLPRLFS